MRPAHHGRVSAAGRVSPAAIPSRRGLPFTDVLTAECISEIVEEIHLCWNECVYTPLATLWVFLGQVLSANQSCSAAVARLPCNNQVVGCVRTPSAAPHATVDSGHPASISTYRDSAKSANLTFQL